MGRGFGIAEQGLLDGVNFKRDAGRVAGQAGAYGSRSRRQCGDDGVVQVGQLGWVGGVDASGEFCLNFRSQNFAHTGFRLGDDDALVVPWTDNMVEAVEDFVRFMAKLAGVAEQVGDECVEFGGTFRAGSGKRFDVEPGATAEFDPATAEEVVVGSADGVGMDLVAAGERADAGEFLVSGEILGEDGEHDLADELFADRLFGIAGDPEAHSRGTA